MLPAPLQGVLIALLVVLALWFSQLVGGGASGPPSSESTPSFGVVSPSSFTPAELRAQGVDRVTLGVGWDVFEPQRGQVSAGYVAELQRRLADYRAAGLEVALDPGLQYPPAWVFSLPGQTRFVDQQGREWRGRLSEDVPNAVFNPAVRAAQQEYLSRLAGALGSGGITAVRLGGLLSGELRYPVASYEGGTGSLWGFDDAARVGAPDPSWRPGTGTDADARRWLQYYFDSLTGYETWLAGRLAAGFPGAQLQLMLPSFGLRPGMVDTAVAGGLDGSSAPERNDLLAQGLDWVGQVAALRRTGLPAVVYTTWLDGPDQGGTPQQEAPVRYLADLARAQGLPVAGENTGGGGQAVLDESLDRAEELGLTGVMWFSGPDLRAGRDGLDLRDVGDTLRARGLAD